ncbi:GNAT family N-acetyltransferase [Nocardia heshunensis]
MNRFPATYLTEPWTPPSPIAEISGVVPADAAQLTRVHVLSFRSALLCVRGSGEKRAVLDRFLLEDLAPRKLPEWTALAARRERGLLVARTATRQVAGFLWSTTDSAPCGVIHSWYVHPRWQGTGVGGALMRATLEDLDRQRVRSIRVWTTEGTAAVGAYRRYGFVVHGATEPTPDRLRAIGIDAPQLSLRRSPPCW